MTTRPIKIVSKLNERLIGFKHNGKHTYDISDYAGLEIEPSRPNDSGVLLPQLWFVFKNTSKALYAINVSRKPDGNYVFGYQIMHGAYGFGSGCFPSMRWKWNSPYSDTLRHCLIKGLRYLKETYGSYYDENSPAVVEAATEAIKTLQQRQARQMTIFDLL